MRDDADILHRLAQLRRVREMRSELARVAAARQQRVAADSRRVLALARDGLMQRVAEKAAIQQRLATLGEREASARTLQDAALDAHAANRQIGAANRSVADAGVRHQGEETQLAQLQHAARRAKAAEDKLDKAAERHRRAVVSRDEWHADEVTDSFAVRRFDARQDDDTTSTFLSPTGGRC
ncbi:hypothetical protein bAD24_p01645 (plasmid) [Burkholderia sp. AD24]|nr:hypothetical protein bAD24_p01645 [Burkholderia sp. AD24]